MRKLTREEQKKIKKRQKGFNDFFNESMPVLKDFIERLGVQNAALVAIEAHTFLDTINNFMASQTIEESDRLWIHTRIGYFIGELLIQRLNGCWFINDIPDSRNFGRYVVGKFTKIKNQSIMVDPFEVASEFLKKPIGRNLKMCIDELFIEIERTDSKNEL